MKLRVVLLTGEVGWGIIANKNLEDISESRLMVKIRLRRVGAKGKPMYRVVVADSRSPRDGAFIEIVGHYNPLTDPEGINIDREKVLKWLGCGAEPTATVARLLTKSGIGEAAKYIPLRRSGEEKTKSTTKAQSTTKET